MASEFMKQAAERDYSRSWQTPGTYPAILQAPKAPARTNGEISTAENYLRCIKNESPLWMPLYQWDASIIWPDAIEEHPVPEADGYDWWGTEWVTAGGSMSVRPGTRVISDFACWKEELEWPDLSVVDFETDGRKIAATLDPERIHIYESTEGLFERLHELLPFEDALMCFYDEPELLEEFFAGMVDYKNETFDKVFKYYGRVDGVTYHDDWGTQRSGFFSKDMFRRQIMPQTKRIVDHIKAAGKIAELHSCGNNMDYVPYMIEMGFDLWAPQQQINDYDLLYEQYNDKMAFAFMVPLHKEMNEAQVRSACREFVLRYGDSRRIMAWVRGDMCPTEFLSAARDEIFECSLEHYRKNK